MSYNEQACLHILQYDTISLHPKLVFLCRVQGVVSDAMERIPQKTITYEIKGVLPPLLGETVMCLFAGACVALQSQCQFWQVRKVGLPRCLFLTSQ